MNKAVERMSWLFRQRRLLRILLIYPAIILSPGPELSARMFGRGRDFVGKKGLEELGGVW